KRVVSSGAEESEVYTCERIAASMSRRRSKRDTAAFSTRFSSSVRASNGGTAVGFRFSSMATKMTMQSAARVNFPSRGSADRTSLTMCMEVRPVYAILERTSTMCPDGIGRVKLMWPKYAVTQYLPDQAVAQA